MDIILTAITPILTTGIQATIIPIIESNLKNLDTIDNEINIKIDKLTGEVKDKIDEIPTIPILFTDKIKTELLAKLPFDKVDESLDKIDLSAINKIKIPQEINADGKITAELAQFPEKIKSKLKSSIRVAFSTTNAATTETAQTDAAALSPAPPSKAEEAAKVEEASTEIQTISIKDAVTDMTVKDKKNTQDISLKAIIDTGIFGNISELIASAKNYENKQAGGAKRKHRRKTKKNIRRNKNAKTRFGRTF